MCCLTVLQGHTDNRVTYPSRQICAVQGSTVDIRCTYTYPFRVNGNATVVEEAVWFTEMNRDEPVDVKTDAEFTDRVQYLCGENYCNLRITDLRKSDSAEYKFMFRTNQPGGKTIGSPGVRLSVTALWVQVVDTSMWYPSWKKLKCSSSCDLPDHHSYIWYMNGQEFHRITPFFAKYFDRSDSIACAVTGHEKFPSPSVCVRGQTCNRVTYTHRSICALRGSSVDISCTYVHEDDVVTKFWFNLGRRSQWRHYSQPEDISRDSQYADRVQVSEHGGRSTLTIRDLKDTDSAEYHFKFKTQEFEWKSSLPGTILTVTVLQVQVTRTISVHQSYTEAELKCQSSCSPAGRLSYIWFKNGQKNTTQKTSTYTDSFYPGDTISCAFKGQEDHRSASVYPSKLPSVSVSPSAEIVEGSSLNLTCSTDANPAATYTWYKEDEDSPKASGQIFTIPDFRAEHKGNYYCEVQNTRGRHNSTLHLTVVSSSWTFPVALTITAVLLAFILLFLLLWIRRQRFFKQQSEAGETPVSRTQEELQYASVQFAAKQPDAVYSNFRPGQVQRYQEESVIYATTIHSSSTAAGTRRQAAVPDVSDLYSKVR
uniref:Ig-like domain-containing protein n=1 Tax=Stegastes partitus TaxID=144197 RepID=A0A3B4ZX82_9TELE